MPPVKRLLPPRSSAEAFSSTSTCAPASHAARAAVKAALPAPTTTTSLNSSGSSTLSLHSSYHAGYISVFTTAPGHPPPLASTLSYDTRLQAHASLSAWCCRIAASPRSVVEPYQRLGLRCRTSRASRQGRASALPLPAIALGRQCCYGSRLRCRTHLDHGPRRTGSRVDAPIGSQSVRRVAQVVSTPGHSVLPAATPPQRHHRTRSGWAAESAAD